MLSSQSVAGVEESRFEAASILARIHVEQVFQPLCVLSVTLSVEYFFCPFRESLFISTCNFLLNFCLMLASNAVIERMKKGLHYGFMS